MTPCPRVDSIRRVGARKSPSRPPFEKPAWLPAEIGHVNAHGSATKVSDLAEARAFGRIFGAKGVPVTALKGYMGNLAAGSGAVELIASLIAVNQGRIPAILNCDNPDPECELDVVLKSPRSESQSDLHQYEFDTPWPSGRGRDPRRALMRRVVVTGMGMLTPVRSRSGVHLVVAPARSRRRRPDHAF